jgi:hypothetical protein
MGGPRYSVEARTVRSASLGYFTKSADQIFEQNLKHAIHESMSPKAIKVREARDSDIHPFTLPIILGLDFTGSMGHIPHELVKDGLPTMISKIIQGGIPSPALLFLGIGDHECDNCPLQVGQFESGDAELDTWLTRSYIEGGGGSNSGESYLLAWYFAAYHTAIDSFEKRGQKGFLFTVGDEPNLDHLPQNVLRDLMDNAVGQGGYTSKQLLKAAQERYNVYHLHLTERSGGRSLSGWRDTLGQNCIEVRHYQDVAKTISDIVVNNTLVNVTNVQVDNKPSVSKLTTTAEEIIL